LSQICILFWQIDFFLRGGIQKPSGTPKGIDCKTSGLRNCTADIGLKQTTEKASRKSKIGKKIFTPILAGSGTIALYPWAMGLSAQK